MRPSKSFTSDKVKLLHGIRIDETYTNDKKGNHLGTPGAAENKKPGQARLRLK